MYRHKNHEYFQPVQELPQLSDSPRPEACPAMVRHFRRQRQSKRRNNKPSHQRDEDMKSRQHLARFHRSPQFHRAVRTNIKSLMSERVIKMLKRRINQQNQHGQHKQRR